MTDPILSQPINTTTLIEPYPLVQSPRNQSITRLEKPKHVTLDTSIDQGEYNLLLQDLQWDDIRVGSPQRDSPQQKCSLGGS